MLAVVAIISVLAGLIIPVLGYAKTQAKKARAREEMNNIRIAMRSFYQEYGYWPHGSTSWTDLSTMLNGNVNPYTGAAAAANAWSTTNNIRAIRFLEFKRESLDSSANFVDPWGNAYRVLIDNGGVAFGDAGWTDAVSGRESGTVANPAGGTIQSQVAIYSTGEDETDNNGANTSDDVKTWNN
jgi:type II secretory pathway pseudopilin PulG